MRKITEKKENIMLILVSYYFFLVALHPNAGYGLLIHEVFEIIHTRRATVDRTPLDE
jgi:hypothetical protein